MESNEKWEREVAERPQPTFDDLIISIMTDLQQQQDNEIETVKRDLEPKV